MKIKGREERGEEARIELSIGILLLRIAIFVRPKSDVAPSDYELPDRTQCQTVASMQRTVYRPEESINSGTFASGWDMPAGRGGGVTKPRSDLTSCERMNMCTVHA